MDAFDKILNSLGWQGGTIHQVLAEIDRLRQIERMVKLRFHTRDDLGILGAVCGFCRAREGAPHTPGCIVGFVDARGADNPPGNPFGGSRNG